MSPPGLQWWWVCVCVGKGQAGRKVVLAVGKVVLSSAPGRQSSPGENKACKRVGQRSGSRGKVAGRRQGEAGGGRWGSRCVVGR